MATQNTKEDKTPKGPPADTQGGPFGTDIKTTTLTGDQIAKAKPPVPQKLVGGYIVSLVGRMVDPLTNTEFGPIPQEVTYTNGWVDSQVEAKKLALCDKPE